MSDIALESQGMKLYVGDVGSPPAFVEIPEVKSIGGPDGQTPWKDTSDLASVAREGRPGLPDEGQIRCSIFYVPGNAVHQTLRNAFKARTKKAFQLLFTDTTPKRWEFDGFVIGFQVRGEVDEAIMAEVTIRISDAIREVN